ncbi:MAG: TetR/AcrR family transcriptional regulator [Actinomycetota bacterium]|nr:TetR/AcrR family transcriptional regulator [Actinomycetota bacterium]
MSIPYEATGRTRQKARTRNALVAAARELVSTGASPTVEAAADLAEIARSTAYRYFPNQRSLLAAAAPVVEAESLLGPDPPGDVEPRLEIVVRELGEQILANEAALRTMLRFSLEPKPPKPEQLVLRRGRAIGWIEEALAPLRGGLGDHELRRLALAIRAAVGIEPLVWLTDIGGLSRGEAVELMRESAGALLRSALADLAGDEPGA